MNGLNRQASPPAENGRTAVRCGVAGPRRAKQHYTLRGSFTAGALIRTAARRMMKQLAHERGVCCRLEEDRGILDSLFLVELSGPEDQVNAVVTAFNRWMEHVNADEE
jgi:hypothetical protein